MPFLLDDEGSITNNRSIRHLWPLRAVLAPPHGGSPVTGRPLVNLSFALNYAVSGTGVRGYHAANLVLHVLAALTLLGLLRRTLLLPSLRGRFESAALPLALATALLWSVHPLQTRAVIYLSHRGELLMGLFFLLTLYCFVRGVQSKAPIAWHFITVLACLLGMCSKEVMVSAPFVVLLYDRTFVAGSVREALRRRWGFYVSLVATWAPLWYFVAGKLSYGGTPGFSTNLTWASYARTQAGAIVHYLRLIVWPHPLVFDHGPGAPPMGAAAVALCALALALLAAGTGLSLRRWPAIGFLGVCFFALLAPSSSVIPIAPELIAESRMYLSLAPALLLIVLAVQVAIPRQSGRLFAALVVAAALLTARRTGDYQSALAIWSDTVAHRPDNPRAHNNLGTALLEAGEMEKSLTHFGRALELQPDYALARTNIGVALVRLGRVDEAIAHFRRDLLTEPGSGESELGLGDALFRAGRLDDAILHYRRATSINPGSGVASLHLANALIGRGDTEEAIAQWQHAAAVNPALAEAHSNLAIALYQTGRTDDAILHIRQALKIRPGDAEARQNLRALSWALSTHPEASRRSGVKALELAQELNRLTGGTAPEDAAALAAAYAEAGRFAEAVATAERALQLARARNDPALADALGAHLERYRARSPLHIAGQRPAAVVPD